MAIERRFFIATTAEEVLAVKEHCTYISDFDEGQIWHDHGCTNHDLWYLDQNELEEGELEKLAQSTEFLDCFNGDDLMERLKGCTGGVPRLSGEYRAGYRKAIMDLQEIFTYIESDLKHSRKQFNGVRCRELLACCLDNRAALQDNPDGFIRWNGVIGKFEYVRK